MEPIRSELGIQRVAGRNVSQAVVEGEIPLPAGREAGRILYSQGEITNSASHVLNSKVQAEGTLALQMLCLDAEQQPFGMRTQTQYTHTVPVEGAHEGMSASVSPQLMDLQCQLRDGKVRLNAVAELNTVVEQREQRQVLADVAGVGEVEKRYTDASVGEWRMVGEENVRLHELIPAPDIASVLLSGGAPQIVNIMLEENGAQARGMLYLNILYADADGQLMQLSQQVPFDVTIPIELDARSCTQVSGDAHLHEIDVSLSMEEGVLEVDAVVAANAYCLGSTQIQGLADAYAPDGSFQCTQSQIEQLSAVGNVSKVLTLNETIRIPEGMPNAYRAVYANARPTMLGLTNSNGQLALDGLFITGVVYQTDEGSVMGFEEDIPFQCALDSPYLPDSDVSVKLLDARVNGGGNAVNVALVLEVSAVLRELQTVSLAVDAEDAEPVMRENGILVSYASEGETFWDTGKRFGVSLSQLRQWNADVQEPFSEGQPILILSASGRKHRI